MLPQPGQAGRGIGRTEKEREIRRSRRAEERTHGQNQHLHKGGRSVSEVQEAMFQAVLRATDEGETNQSDRQSSSLQASRGRRRARGTNGSLVTEWQGGEPRSGGWRRAWRTERKAPTGRGGPGEGRWCRSEGRGQAAAACRGALLFLQPVKRGKTVQPQQRQ